MFGSVAEWVIIFGGIVQLIFFAGVYWQLNKARNTKVDDHEKDIKDLRDKLKGLEDNVHGLKNNFSQFKAASDTKTSIILMLLFQVCKAQGLDTDMAQFILETDTPDTHKKHKV